MQYREGNTFKTDSGKQLANLNQKWWIRQLHYGTVYWMTGYGKSSTLKNYQIISVSAHMVSSYEQAAKVKKTSVINPLKISVFNTVSYTNEHSKFTSF